MQHSLVSQLVVIFVLLHCIQAGIVRHFDTNRDVEYHFEKHRLHKSDNHGEVDELTQRRARRQNVGGDPEAFESRLNGDSRQYGRVSYSGEGSKVKCVIC